MEYRRFKIPVLFLFLVWTVEVLGQTPLPGGVEPLPEALLSEVCGVPGNETIPVCRAVQTGICTSDLTVAGCELIIEASQPAENSGASSNPSKGDLSENRRSSFSTLFDENLAKALGGLLVALFTLMTARLNQLHKRLGDPFTVRWRRPHETYGVNVVMVGEGGSGKTSIIRALSGSGEANPEFSTKEFREYNIVQEIDVQGEGKERIRSLYRIYLEDYEGQDTGSRVHHKEVRKRERRIPSTVLIIVVDLFPTPARHSNPLTPQKDWDAKRVEHQLSQYPKALIDVIKGVSNRWTHVCLFINKSDLIRPYRSSTDERIRSVYRDLSNRLSSEFRDVPFSVIVGSATMGLGVVGWDDIKKGDSLTLREMIRKSAVMI